MTTLTTSQPASGSVRSGQLWIAALIGGVVAAVVDTVLLVAGKAAGVAFLAPVDGPGEPLRAVQVMNVVVMCLLPALGAALLLALLGRFTRRPYPIFLAIACTLLLVSLYPDWALPMDSLATRVMLSVMHLVAGMAIVGAQLRAHVSSSSTNS